MMTPEEKKLAHAKANKKWRDSHKEEHKKYQKKYRDTHREEHNAWQRRWRQEHPDKVKESTRKYYEANKEKISAYHKQHYQNNKEKYLDSHRKYNIKSGRENLRTDFLLNKQDECIILMFEDILDNRRIAEIEIIMEYSIKWYGEEM